MAKASFKMSLYPNNVALLNFSGTLDAMIVNKAVNDCFNRNIVNIVVQLDQVLYTNSAFLSTFINLNSMVEKRSGRIAFVQPPKNILIIMTLMGFKEYFEFYRTKKDALSSMIY